MLEKTSNWPSTPSPGIGTQLPLKSQPMQPQFLTDIEQYIERELLEVETTGDVANPEALAEQRLGVFSHAFEMFISRLSTYQPLLSEIHKEYELAVMNLRRKVQEHLSTTSQLGTLKERTVVLVNTLKAEYTKKLRAVQEESAAKDSKLFSMRGEMRSAQHEMEKAIEAREKLKAKSTEQHESSAILWNMILLKERELATVKNTGIERDMLQNKNAGLEDRIKELQGEAAYQMDQAEILAEKLKVANGVSEVAKAHNEELLAQLKQVNEDYSAATEKLQEQAGNWQMRATEGAGKKTGMTPRPNMKALNLNLSKRSYPVPSINIKNRSSVEVVGQLYWEIDRLCAELHKNGIDASEVMESPPRSPEPANKSTEVPRYLRTSGTPLDTVEIGDPEILELARSFWQMRAMDAFEDRDSDSASEAFAAFMEDRYGSDEAAEWSYSVCQALFSYAGALPRPCALLLKLLQEDPDQPLTMTVLGSVTVNEITMANSPT